MLYGSKYWLYFYILSIIQSTSYATFMVRLAGKERQKQRKKDIHIKMYDNLTDHNPDGNLKMHI